MYVCYDRFLQLSVSMLLSSRYFLEEDAVDSNENLVREKQKSVNKIGHGGFIQSSLIFATTLIGPSNSSARTRSCLP